MKKIDIDKSKIKKIGFTSHVGTTLDINSFIKISPKQAQVLKYVGGGYFIFYGGGRGSGKSHLMRSAAIWACLKYPGLQACIIRESFPELEKNFIRPFLRDVPAELYNYTQQKKSAAFYNGSVLDFIGVNKLRDIEKIKGIEYGLICLDEGNNLEWDIINGVRGSNRSMVAKKFIPTMLMTGNPGGSSDQAMKDYFVFPDYTKWTEEELKQKDKYVYVHATVYDNPDKNFVDTYVQTLKTMPDYRIKQWLDGDWNSFSGQFFEEWVSDIHVIEPFDIPPHWRRFCGLDLGKGRHPSVCLWFAENPETLDIYCYREYVTKEPTMQFALMTSMYSKDEMIERMAADTNFWEKSNDSYESESPAFMFLREGLVLEPAPKNRKVGWNIVKQWLHFNDVVDENNELGVKPVPYPKLRFFNNCKYTTDTIPRLRYNGKGDDLDTDMDDHAADALRYALVTCVRYPYSDQESVDKQLSMLSNEQKMRLEKTTGDENQWNEVVEGASRKSKEIYLQETWAMY